MLTNQGAALSSKPKRREPTPAEKAASLRQADRADRARRSYHKLDQSGVYHEKCTELAQECGVEFLDVWEEFGDRAAVRTYLGEQELGEAERLAFEDTCSRFRRAA